MGGACRWGVRFFVEFDSKRVAFFLRELREFFRREE